MPLLPSLQALVGRSYLRLQNLALDWGLRGGHSDYARFIILGEGRSGSNFLRGLLNSHPRITVFGELFRFDEAIGWECPAHDRYLSTPRLLSLSQRAPAVFLEREVFRRVPLSVQAVGFKIFYHHAQNGPRHEVWSYLREDRGVRVIHIKRWNMLRSLLSLKKAFLTNRWTEVDGAPPDTLSLALDYDECRYRFERARDEREHFDALFRGHPAIDVIYEDLARNSVAEMARVQDFLGVEHHAVRPLTYKQASLPLARSITNYSELKRKFEDTPWAPFFDE